MRSIRFSLIVYFLLLVALALGGVSWFVYRTTAQTLRDKQESTRDLVLAQYLAQKEEVMDALDRRIHTRAHDLAGLARFSNSNFEPLNVLGALSTPLNPHGIWTIDLWLAEGLNPRLVWGLFRMRPIDILIETSEDLTPHNLQQPQEYFQTFRGRGQSIQRSESMDDMAFTLDAELRDNLKLYQEHFDNVSPRPDLNVRRVTLKAPVLRHRPTALPWRFLFPGKSKGKGPQLPVLTPGSGNTPTSPVVFVQPTPPPRPSGGVETFAPVIFIQYASDTSHRDAKIRELQTERDAKLAQIDDSTRIALGQLQVRLLGICVAAFAATILGGFLLVRIGLRPLARLSDAVSRVSEKDFRLRIDQQALPRELQPIAGRLSNTLDQLQRAFDREKQAAADISHELRTPLAAIMTTLEVALKKSRTAAEYRELLEECRSSGQHMSVLVERLLSLARLDAGAVAIKNEAVDASLLARQCANLVKPLAEARGVSLSVSAEQPVNMESDPDKLREVLTNLLHNAIQYNKPQGSIDIDVRRDNGHVRFAVRDTGIGIPAEARQRIFERFYRADPSRHTDAAHTGLGLAIVKGYLDLMGGTIGVESGTEGSTFTVDLPANQTGARA